MDEIKEKAAPSEQIKEAQEWLHAMIDSGRITMIRLAKIAGFHGPSIISQFYADKLYPQSKPYVARKILEVRDLLQVKIS